MEQLQKTLNKYIEMGYSFRGIIVGVEVTLYEEYILYVDRWCDLNQISYHDLFSIDSGLMEFVDRDIKDMFVKRGQEELLCIAYDTMSMMTAQEKIDFFNYNTTPPQV